MWRNEDDSRKSAAYGCLSKSQLNQYRTALAMRTLGSDIRYVEVEETELRVVRGAGGTSAFVFLCVHVHGRREEKHAYVVCVHDAFVSKVHSCRGEKKNSLAWVGVP